MADGQGEAARGTSGQAILRIMDKWDIGAMSNEET